MTTASAANDRSPPFLLFALGSIQLPQIIEPMRRRPRVVRGMAGIPVPEVILDQRQVTPLVRKGKPAGMTQHVGMNAAEASASSGGSDDVVDRLPSERLTPLGDDQPGELILPPREPA